jgi:Domain of unknown function (DUF4198)
MRLVRHLVAGISVVAVATGSPAAVAHEFWIEPSSFLLRPSERVELRLCIGDGGDARPVARDASRIEMFSSIGPTGRQSVPGLHGSDPAGIARFTAPGDYVVAYETNHTRTTQTAAQFDEYLREVGLETIAAARRKRGHRIRVVREAYSRHAKALLGVGAGPTPPQDHPVGLRLELILDGSQSSPGATDESALRLLYLGRPLAGALVTATALGSRSGTLQARSDAGGRVSFALRPGETWRINAVHMVHGDRELGADWESLWASLVFELPAGTTRRNDRIPECAAPAASNTARNSRLSQEIPPPPPPPLSSPQLVSPVTVVPARLSRKIVPFPQRPPLLVVPKNSVALS